MYAYETKDDDKGVEEMNLEEVRKKCTDVSIATINLGNEYSLTKEVKWLIEQAEKAEKLKQENQWLYGKLNIISDVIEKARDEVPKF